MSGTVRPRVFACGRMGDLFCSAVLFHVEYSVCALSRSTPTGSTVVVHAGLIRRHMPPVWSCSMPYGHDPRIIVRIRADEKKFQVVQTVSSPLNDLIIFIWEERGWIGGMAVS